VLSLIKIYLSDAAAAAAHSERSVLKAETFRCLEESQSLDEFLRANTGGSNPLLFPTLLGLGLAEDFDLGTRFETRQNTERGGSCRLLFGIFRYITHGQWHQYRF